MLLWLSLLAPAVAWAFDQGASYALVKPVCFANATYALTLISAVALAIVIAGGLLGRACLRRAGEGRVDGGTRTDRSYFLALVAIGFNALVGLLIVFATVPQFVLSPCE
jgi:hypothetical protein